MKMTEERDLRFPDGRVLTFPTDEAADLSDRADGGAGPLTSLGISALPFDAADRDWSYSIEDLRSIDGSFVVIARIMIDGRAAEGIGTASAAEADAVEKAERAAFGNALRKFSALCGHQTDLSVCAGKAAATSLSDMITSSQLRRAKEIACESGTDADAEAEQLFGYRLGELSRVAAEHLIGSLTKRRAEFRSAA